MSSEKIHEISKVDALIHKSNPPRLHVTATGSTSSGSHLNPRLNYYVYVRFPEDGIQEYDFIIDVPEGGVTSDMKEHIVEDHWENPPVELKGVRIYAKINASEASI